MINPSEEIPRSLGHGTELVGGGWNISIGELAAFCHALRVCFVVADIGTRSFRGSRNFVSLSECIYDCRLLQYVRRAVSWIGGLKPETEDLSRPCSTGLFAMRRS